MKYIQKHLATLAAAGLVIAMSAPGHAVFTTKGSQTVSASASTGGAAIVSITSLAIKNRSDNAPVGALSWTGAAPGAGFLVADQYIQMVTNITQANGGVQIYTDNTNAAANPKYSGQISSFTPTPAGLVNTLDTTQVLPTQWRASTFTLTGLTGSNPNNAADPNHSLWFFHEDRAQVANPSLNAALFGNGDPFVTVYASPATPLVSQVTGQTFTTTSTNSGVHFAQGPTQFGGFSTTATTFIYTEADFTGALALQTYSTNRIILEAFSL